MFKFLSSRSEDPGFPNAVILTNKSGHWLVVDDAGRRIPPKGHAAMDAPSVASSMHISEHVESGILVVSASESVTQAKPKKKRKPEQQEAKVSEQGVETELQPEPHPEPQPEPKPEPQPTNVGGNQEEQAKDTLVAEPEHENWVSSNENIVGLPTTDEI